jgi:predicted transcriptional regulator
MDFSPEDLFDACDRVTAAALARAGIEGPPVDALFLAEHGFNLRVEYFEPDDPRGRQYGDRPRPRPRADTVLLREDMSTEAQHLLAARAVARLLVPEVLRKLGVMPDGDNRQAVTHLTGVIAPRLILPSRWFPGDAGRAGYDLFKIKERYATANYETIALRYLDLDEPCVIAIVDDDGTIAVRKSNRFQAPKKLTEAEQSCRALIEESGEPARARGAGWIVWGWPTPGIPFRRMVFRSVPEDV